MSQEKTRDFQKGLDGEERRRAREDDRLRLRKADREERLKKKRIHIENNENLPANDANGEQILSHDFVMKQLNELPKLAQMCYSNNQQQQYAGLTQIRRLLSIEKSPPIKEVISIGIIPKFVEFLNSGYPNLQFEASWALTNIASGSKEETSIVIEAGAVPAFVSLLNSPDISIIEQAVWALGNIAGDSDKTRDLVLKNDCLEKLGPIIDKLVITLKTNNDSILVSLLNNIAWTLSNLFRGKPRPEWKYVKLGIPLLSKLLTSDDIGVLTDACWACAYLTESDRDNFYEKEIVKCMIELNMTEKLIQLLGHASSLVQHPALRGIGNILTGDETQTQHMIDKGVVLQLKKLLDNDKKTIIRECCWALSNIAAGTSAQVQHIISNNLVEKLIELMKYGSFDVRKEATWTICNSSTGGTSQQIKFLVQQGALTGLIGLLDPGVKEKLLQGILEGLENIFKMGELDAHTTNGNPYTVIFEECGGLDKLESLQENPLTSEVAYTKAGNLIRTYFGGEVVDDDHHIDMDPCENQRDQPFVF